MNLRMIILSIIALFFTLSSHASGLSNQVMVKVESGLCAHDDRNFHGSGTLFKNNGAVFVITSEHVILHDNGKYCHQVLNSSIGTISAQLAAVDWGTGLALLKVNPSAALSRISANIPTLESLNPSTPAQNSDGVIVSGFPYASEALVWDKKGSVLLAHSDRTWIPLLQDVIELQNAQGEYGMSGGSVLRNSDQAFLGVLSHQVIKMVPGSESKVTDFTNGAVIQNHLIVIPAPFVTQWLNSYFANPSAFTPNFLRDADQQYLGNEVIISSGLRFELKNLSDSKQGSGVGGGDGAGVGGSGGDGAGVGGGDGAGVGGDSTTVQNTSVPKTVAVSLANNAPGFNRAVQWSSPAQTAFLSKIQDSLLKRNTIQIPFLMARFSDDRKMRSESIESLSQFIHDLSFENVTAKIVETSSLNDEKKSISSFQLVGTTLQSQSEKLLANTTLSLRAKQLLTSLKTVGDVFASGDSSGIQTDDLNAYLKDDATWTELFNLNFDETVKLRKSLISAIALLS